MSDNKILRIVARFLIPLIMLSAIRAPDRLCRSAG